MLELIPRRDHGQQDAQISRQPGAQQRPKLRFKKIRMRQAVAHAAQPHRGICFFLPWKFRPRLIRRHIKGTDGNGPALRRRQTGSIEAILLLLAVHAPRQQ